jgi:hypothetical protein
MTLSLMFRIIKSTCRKKCHLRILLCLVHKNLQGPFFGSISYYTFNKTLQVKKNDVTLNVLKGLWFKSNILALIIFYLNMEYI